jgi:hypothetical protein
MFKGMPVGYFEEPEYPRQSGCYRYVPYRGPGHYQMQSERRERGRARCYFNVGVQQISFAVLDCPDYGVLQLAEFEVAPKEEAEGLPPHGGRLNI